MESALAGPSKHDNKYNPNFFPECEKIAKLIKLLYCTTPIHLPLSAWSFLKLIFPLFLINSIFRLFPLFSTKSVLHYYTNFSLD